jgi:signal peptidase I
MDTQAQHAERDRSTTALSGDEGGEERSRSTRLSRRPERTLLPGARPARLPGGRPLAALLLCVTLVLLAGRFVMQPFEIPSGSMEPGLRVGDRVLVNKLAYRFGAEPGRGDVVVFDGTGYFGNADYIKRVVGVGGDHVTCCDSQGRIEVNGRPAVEHRYLYPGDAPSEVPFDVRVPEGTLFLLGDHRSVSSDSRDRLGAPGGGMVPLGAVIGKAEWVAWPPGHWATAGLGAPADDRHARIPGRAQAAPDARPGTARAAAVAGPPELPGALPAPPDGAHG